MVERDTIEQALNHFHGNKTQTAIALKISLSTIERRIEEYEHEKRVKEIEQRKYRDEQERINRRQRGLAEAADIRQGYVFQAEQRFSVQSAEETPAKHDVPVSVGEEVQNLLPVDAPRRRGRPRRTNIPKTA